MIVYLIRHAQSQSNVNYQRAQTFAEYAAMHTPDPSLTEIGYEQAKLVADHLQSEQHIDRIAGVTKDSPWDGYNISKLFCSPMLRTMETAQPISQTLGLNPQLWVNIHEHGGLHLYNSPTDREDVANHPGMGRSEIETKFPGYALADEINEDGWWYGEKEDLATCMGRAARVAYELRERAKGQHEDGNTDVIALVTHGTFIDCLIKALLNKLPDASLYFRHYNTAISRVDFKEDGTMFLRYINRTQHLPAGYLTE